MKKFILISVIAILFAGFLSLSAAQEVDIGIRVNGQPVVFTGQTPVNIEGRILVPVRDVFAALGFTPYWDGELRQATLISDESTIVIVIDSMNFTINDEQHEFDIPAQIINDATLIPLGAVLRAMDIEPGWDVETSTVVINMPGFDPYPSRITGAWDFMGVHYYTFNEDGSGFRGYTGNLRNFQWTAEDGVLSIVTDAVEEYWFYALEGDFLVIVSRQVDGFSYIYTRHGAAVPGVGSVQAVYIPDYAHDIAGIWDWSGQPYYVFHADGSGARGVGGAYQHFRWTASGGVLFIHGVGQVEEWAYAIAYDMLTLTSSRFGTFEYVRR